MTKYQAKFNTSEEAHTEAKEVSKQHPDNEYSVIESVDNGEKRFYVEDEVPFIRAWETLHGYYQNGKFIKE